MNNDIQNTKKNVHIFSKIQIPDLTLTLNQTPSGRIEKVERT
jgi:hypothetical protein